MFINILNNFKHMKHCTVHKYIDSFGQALS